MVRKDKDGEGGGRREERVGEERDSPKLATCVDCVLVFVIV